MIIEQATVNPVGQALPQTLAEFMVWEPTDGHKYESKDGELIRFTGMKKKELYIADLLQRLVFSTGYFEQGALLAEADGVSKCVGQTWLILLVRKFGLHVKAMR